MLKKNAREEGHALHECAPRRWVNYRWDDASAPCALELRFKSDSREAQKYSLERLGQRKPLTDGVKGGRQLFVCVYADGPMRVLCLTDTPETHISYGILVMAY